MSPPATSSNLLRGENTIENRTKENVRSLLERFLALHRSWHVSMGSCGMETKRCCLAKPLKAGASWEAQPAPWAPQLDGELLFRDGHCCQAHLKVDFSKGWSRSLAFAKNQLGRHGLSAGRSCVEALSSSRSLFWFLRRGLLDVEASPCFYLHPTLTSLRAEGGEFMAAPQRAEELLKVTPGYICWSCLTDLSCQ